MSTFKSQYFLIAVVNVGVVVESTLVYGTDGSLLLHRKLFDVLLCERLFVPPERSLWALSYEDS